MTHREAKGGAAVAGAILLAMPILEVALGVGVAGPLHFIVGMLGAALVAAGVSGRVL